MTAPTRRPAYRQWARGRAVRPAVLTTASLHTRWRANQGRRAGLPDWALVVILPKGNPRMRARLLAIVRDLGEKGTPARLLDEAQGLGDAVSAKGAAALGCAPDACAEAGAT